MKRWADLEGNRDSPQGVLHALGDLLFGEAKMAWQEVAADTVGECYFRGGQCEVNTPMRYLQSVPAVTRPCPDEHNVRKAPRLDAERRLALDLLACRKRAHTPYISGRIGSPNTD